MALKAQQSVLKMTNDDSPETFTEIEQVTSISGPDGSANLIDATHLRSTAKEYLQGLADYGKVQLECNFVGGTAAPKQMDLRDKYSSQADPHNYRLEIPNSPSGTHIFAFSGIVTAWSLSLPTDDKVSLSVSIQVNGTPTYTAPV